MNGLSRLRAALWMVAPIAVSLAVYWPGIQCWFRMDDFAWLGLRLEVFDWRDLMRALFEPKAQGTMRVWSERAFFLGFFQLFELDALPYRMLVFATHVLNMALLGMLARRLTGGELAASAAMLLWGVNAALSTPLAWTSVYNQILCASFLMGALLLFIRYCDTGATRYWWMQFGVFVLGFGALEMNAAYPALAFAWALLFARRRLVSTLPLFAASAVYTAIHNHFAPKQKAGTYGMNWDASMIDSFARYCLDAFGGTRLRDFFTAPWVVRVSDLAAPLLLASAVTFVLWRLWRRDVRVLFPAAWFCALLGPILPLRDHYSYYYLTMPTIGVGLLGGLAIAEAPLAAGAMAVVYLATQAPLAHAIVRHDRNRTHEVRTMVFGIERARQLHPGKLLLLTNVTSDLYWWGINDDPFRLIGLRDVDMTPGSEDNIQPHAGYGDPTEHILPPGQTLRALAKDEALVYAVENGKLRNFTRQYRALAQSRWKAGLAHRIDVARASFADQVGEGWHPSEDAFRWMTRRGVVWLAGPRTAAEKLYVSGYCAKAVVEAGPLNLTVRVDGQTAGALRISQPDAGFELVATLPAAAIGKEKIEVVTELDRGLKVAGYDGDLGIVFGTFAIR